MALKSYLSISKLVSILFSQNSQDVAVTPNTGTTYTAPRSFQLPAGDVGDVLVGRASTDTLLNKSISGSTNTITAVPLTTAVTGSLPIANGGTANVTAPAAFSALSPMTTTGDLIYSSAGTTASRLGIGGTGQLLTVVSGAPAWTTVSPLQDAPSDQRNYGLSCSVATNALTINLTDKSGATPTSISPVNISFRNSVQTIGTYSVVPLAAALSIVVSSGATLGQLSNIGTNFYVYALNNAGVIELAVSTKKFSNNTIQSTTAMSATATSAQILYSTTVRTGVAISLIGKIFATQTVAGTWTSLPTEITLDSMFLTGGMVGRTDGLTTSTGYVGELLTASAGSVALTSGVYANMTSLSIPAGAWVIKAYGYLTGALGQTGFTVGISTDSVATTFSDIATAASPSASNVGLITISGIADTAQQIHKAINTTSTTTYYLKGKSIGAAGTAGGYLEVRRIPS